LWNKFFSRKGWKSYILPGMLALAVLFGFFLIGAYAWIGRELPDPDRIADRDVAESTKIYARDEKTLLYEIHGEEKRTIISLDEITSDMRWATIAIEDQDFYQHGGFDVNGLIRSVFKNIFTGSRVGGSTITQQLVKNAILSPEKTYTRKFKELILSFQIERRFSKDEILQLYFNEIPYGANAYGVEAAALTYFGISAKDLTLAQSAILAALPQAPSYYSPFGNNTDALLGRAHHIIDRMLEEGFISDENAIKAKEEDVLAQIEPRKDTIRAPHFVIWVREKLAEEYGDAVLERGGLRVTTTLDARMQEAMESAVAEYAERNATNYNANNAAAVGIDPRTGQVLAMVGSKDYFDTENDGNVNVALRTRNPGSSFKPFVYAAAFARGYTPETTLFDLVTNFGADGSGKIYEPKNYDLSEHGPISMRQALAGSLNIPAVKALYLAGIPNTLDLAERAGYTTLGDRDNYGLALALGGGGVQLLEHVSAFSSFINDGGRQPVQTILKIEDPKGKILKEYTEQENIEVMSKEVAHTVASILSDNNARAFIFGGSNHLTLGGRPVGAKTGTTNDFRDAWTIGFTPSLAAGVWVGNNDNSEMGRGADGSIVAAPIWNSFMRTALEGTDFESFPSPPRTPDNLKPILSGSISGAEPVKVDTVTKKRIPEACLNDWPENFVSTIEVSEAHTILYYVNKEDPRGDPPSDPAKDPQYNRWEEPVRAWAEKNGYVATLPDEESCDLRSSDAVPQIDITSPKKNTTLEPGDIDVNATISTQHGIKSVSLYLDDVVVDEQKPKIQKDSTLKVVLSFDASKTPSGFHTLRVEGNDIYDNVASSSVLINILDASGVALYFTSPQNDITVDAADFPFSVSGFASAPNTIEKVELLYRVAGKDTILATALAPKKNDLTLVWKTKPTSDGDLFLKITTKEGVSLSDFITVTVK
jgi:penicillin-binding protein 1C